MSAIVQALGSTKAVMLNGFVFDELSTDVVKALADCARTGGASVFFDPGKLHNSILAFI